MTAELLLEGKKCLLFGKNGQALCSSPSLFCSQAAFIEWLCCWVFVVNFFLISVCDEQSWDRYEK